MLCIETSQIPVLSHWSLAAAETATTQTIDTVCYYAQRATRYCHI